MADRVKILYPLGTFRTQEQLEASSEIGSQEIKRRFRDLMYFPGVLALSLTEDNLFPTVSGAYLHISPGAGITRAGCLISLSESIEVPLQNEYSGKIIFLDYNEILASGITTVEPVSGEEVGVEVIKSYSVSFREWDYTSDPYCDLYPSGIPLGRLFKIGENWLVSTSAGYRLLFLPKLPYLPKDEFKNLLGHPSGLSSLYHLLMYEGRGVKDNRYNPFAISSNDITNLKEIISDLLESQGIPINDLTENILKVSPSPPDRIVINPGEAIDSYGRRIYVHSPQYVIVPDDGNIYNVVLSYAETNEKDSFQISLTQSSPSPSQILLARVQRVGNNITVTDCRARNVLSLRHNKSDIVPPTDPTNLVLTTGLMRDLVADPVFTEGVEPSIDLAFINAKWDPSTDEDSGVAGYEVTLCPVGPDEEPIAEHLIFQIIRLSTQTSTSFLNLRVGVKYEVSVRAFDKAYNFSNWVSKRIIAGSLPSVPSPPPITVTGLVGGVRVDWDDVEGAAGYEVFARENQWPVGNKFELKYRGNALSVFIPGTPGSTIYVKLRLYTYSGQRSGFSLGYAKVKLIEDEYLSSEGIKEEIRLARGNFSALYKRIDAVCDANGNILDSALNNTVLKQRVDKVLDADGNLIASAVPREASVDLFHFKDGSIVLNSAKVAGFFSSKETLSGGIEKIVDTGLKNPISVVQLTPLGNYKVWVSTEPYFDNTTGTYKIGITLDPGVSSGLVYVFAF